ncbi:PspA/IM30 family protein, partial [Salmonella enterica]|uniref:PspA/IM30 family protein n=1 Tax=Salmonella enterica TaxID=28901 RepID=UPI003CF7BABD
MRQRLTDLEAEVQKAYTKKQVLIARDKAAQATSKANEILSKTTTSGAMSVMERMETKVQEKE